MGRITYEKGVKLWEETKGEHEFGIEPISPALDEDLFAIQVAKELNISALEVEHIPPHWLFVVRTKWAWEDVERKKAERSRKRK